jgi:hypothetical protein
LDVAFDGLSDLGMATMHTQRNVVPYCICMEVADDLIDVETMPRVQFGANYFLGFHRTSNSIDDQLPLKLRLAMDVHRALDRVRARRPRR